MMPEQMTFSEALGLIKSGVPMARVEWTDKWTHIAIQTVHEDSDMTLPYMYMKIAGGSCVPWSAPITDILADDWIRV